MGSAGVPPENPRAFLRAMFLAQGSDHYRFYRHRDSNKASFPLPCVGRDLAYAFYGPFDRKDEEEARLQPFGQSPGARFMTGLGDDVIRDNEKEEEEEEESNQNSEQAKVREQGPEKPDDEDDREKGFLKPFVDAKRLTQEQAAALEGKITNDSQSKRKALDVGVGEWYRYLCRRTKRDRTDIVKSSNYVESQPPLMPPTDLQFIPEMIPVRRNGDLLARVNSDLPMSALAMSLFLAESITHECSDWPFCNFASFAQPRCIQNRPLDFVKLKKFPLLNVNDDKNDAYSRTGDIFRATKLSLIGYTPAEATSNSRRASYVASCLSPFDPEAVLPFVGCQPEADCLDGLLGLLGDDVFVAKQQQQDESQSPATRYCSGIHRFLELLRLRYGSLATVQDWVMFHRDLRKATEGQFPFLPAPQSFEDLYWQSKLFVHKATPFRFAVLDGQNRLQHVVFVMLGLTLGRFTVEVARQNAPDDETSINKILEVFSKPLFPDIYVPTSSAGRPSEPLYEDLESALSKQSLEIQKIHENTGLLTVSDRWVPHFTILMILHLLLCLTISNIFFHVSQHAPSFKR